MALIITYPSALEYWLEDEGIPYSIKNGSFMEPVSSSALYQETYKRAEFMRTLDFLNFKNAGSYCCPW